MMPPRINAARQGVVGGSSNTPAPSLSPTLPIARRRQHGARIWRHLGSSGSTTRLSITCADVPRGSPYRAGRAYAKAQGLALSGRVRPIFTDTPSAKATVVPSPPGQTPAGQGASSTSTTFSRDLARYKHVPGSNARPWRAAIRIGDGDVVISAITSCTNPSTRRAGAAGWSPRSPRTGPQAEAVARPASRRIAVVTDYLSSRPEPPRAWFTLVGYAAPPARHSGPLPSQSSTLTARHRRRLGLSANRNSSRVSPDGAPLPRLAPGRLLCVKGR